MTRFLSLVVMLLFLAGCGGGKNAPTGTVTGKITYKGQPVNGAALQLIQTTGQGDSHNIPVTQEGTFNVSSVPVGEYIVVVVPAAGSPMHVGKNASAEVKAKADEMKITPTIPIPEKYKQRLKSDLRLTVTAGVTTQDFELKD
jgi:hypothetical protein